MKRNKKLVALILGLLMVAALVAACGPTGTAPAAPGAPAPAAPPTAPPAPGQETTPPPAVPEAPAEANFASAIDVIVDNNNIAVLDPFNPAANQASTNWAFVMIYDRLLNVDTEGNFSAGLATEWTTDDYQTFRLTLREGVTFHNGEPFTAEDVRWTIEASREGASQATDQWRPVQQINILGTHEIELVLESVNVDFWFHLAFPSTGIVNQRAMTDDPENGTWIGTGAFTVATFVSGDYVVLQRNNAWWDSDVNGGRRFIPTEQITLRFVPEVPARRVMLENLESQLSFGTGAEDVAWFQASPDFDYRPLIMNNPQNLSFSMIHPITGDWYFRQAVIHALDLDDIAVAAAGDWAWGEYISGTFWGFETPFRNDTIPMVERDLDRARAYLEQSVYNGETIELAAAIVTNIRAAEQVQLQLAQIGIDINVNSMDSATLGALMRYGNEDKQMVFFNTAITMNPGSVRAALYPGLGQNRTSFNNPEVSQLLDDARVTADVNARRDMYFRIQEIVAYERPHFNVFWRVNAIVFANGVGGFTLPADHMHTDMRGLFWDLDA